MTSHIYTIDTIHRDWKRTDNPRCAKMMSLPLETPLATRISSRFPVDGHLKTGGFGSQEY